MIHRVLPILRPAVLRDSTTWRRSECQVEPQQAVQSFQEMGHESMDFI
jgi:hypothetical protein